MTERDCLQHGELPFRSAPVRDGGEAGAPCGPDLDPREGPALEQAETLPGLEDWSAPQPQGDDVETCPVCGEEHVLDGLCVAPEDMEFTYSGEQGALLDAEESDTQRRRRYETGGGR